MRCAAHVSALKRIFDGNANLLTSQIVMTSKIGLTPAVLAEYTNELGRDMRYQAWFAAAQASNRLVIRAAEDAPTAIRSLANELLNYGAASYFSGGKLCATNGTTGLDAVALQSVGISIFDVSDPPPAEVPGDNPILSINLSANGNKNFDIFDDFIRAEEQIIIYDKYINDASMEFIEHIASRLSNASTLHVRTTARSNKCKTPAEIATRLSATNPHLNVTAKLVSADFDKQTHDRYIFFGARLQAILTTGLDCFGKLRPDGTRRNRQSNINIFCLESAGTLDIEAADGTVISTPHIN